MTPLFPALRPSGLALTGEFAAAGDVSGQIARLIDMGRAFDGLPDGDKNAVTRIHGCQSQLWLKAQLNGQIMTFRADSDSLVMRGLLAVILQIYEGKRPDQIVRHDTGAVDTMKIGRADV